MTKFTSLFALIFCLLWSSFSYATETAKKENAKLKSIVQAFEKIKGCYWIKENLLDPTFQTEIGYPTKNTGKQNLSRNKKFDKKTLLTSMITGVYDSHIFFHPKTKKPFKEVYISLRPSNTHPARDFQFVIDPETFGVKGLEIRGNFVGPVLDRNTVGKSNEEIKSAAKKPEETLELRQEFVAVGKFSTGVRILVNSTSARDSGIGAVSSLYSYMLMPADKDDCDDNETIEKGLPPPERF